MSEALLNSGELTEVLKLGASVQVKNDGHHWLITLGNTRIDYWPSSERFQVTYKSPINRGYDRMLSMLAGERGKKHGKRSN